jgi:signal transduction histidine kinase
MSDSDTVGIVLGVLSLILTFALGVIAIWFGYVLYRRSSAATTRLAHMVDESASNIRAASDRLDRLVEDLEAVTRALRLERDSHTLEDYVVHWLREVASDGSWVAIGRARQAVVPSRFPLAQLPNSLRRLKDRHIVALSGPVESSETMLRLCVE